jgi:hypothetical protein
MQQNDVSDSSSPLDNTSGSWIVIAIVTALIFGGVILLLVWWWVGFFWTVIICLGLVGCISYASNDNEELNGCIGCLVVVVAILAIAGWLVPGYLSPPVQITYRESLVGIGMVVRIENTSSHHLYNVKVVGRNFKEIQSASVMASRHLRPHTTVEVGWLEFEGWVPRPGESIEVYCDDYWFPSVSLVPEPDDT